MFLSKKFDLWRRPPDDRCSEQLLEEADGKGGAENNDCSVGEDDFVPAAPIKSPRGYCSGVRLWKILLQASIIVAGFVAAWKIGTPRHTNLHSNVLTPDNKSFPSGQLTWSQHFHPLPCGRTPAEAIAKGCRFDIITTAWLPERCIDRALVSEFMELYPWQYFPNPNGTSPFSNDPDTLGAQTGLIWTTSRWHAAHCLFMWKKLNRALVQGRSTDGETVTQWHTDHCSMTILKYHDPDRIGSIMEIIYPPC